MTDLRKAVSEGNMTEELHHTQATEQIHILFSTVADLQQRVLSLENAKQSVSNVAALSVCNHLYPLAETVCGVCK